MTSKKNTKNSKILQDIWKILYATETFSMVGLKRKGDQTRWTTKI